MKNKISLAIALLFLVYFQLRIWTGDQSVQAIKQLDQKITRLDAKKDAQSEVNSRLLVRIDQLNSHDGMVEELARSRLGFVKKDETFVLVTGSRNE